MKSDFQRSKDSNLKYAKIVHDVVNSAFPNTSNQDSKSKLKEALKVLEKSSIKHRERGTKGDSKAYIKKTTEPRAFSPRLEDRFRRNREKNRLIRSVIDPESLQAQTTLSANDSKKKVKPVQVVSSRKSKSPSSPLAQFFSPKSESTGFLKKKTFDEKSSKELEKSELIEGLRKKQKICESVFGILS